MNILWPRWVARIGVTRSTQACVLAADRQCTELPLLRLPRLLPEVVGCDPASDEGWLVVESSLAMRLRSLPFVLRLPCFVGTPPNFASNRQPTYVPKRAAQWGTSTAALPQSSGQAGRGGCGGSRPRATLLPSAQGRQAHSSRLGSNGSWLVRYDRSQRESQPEPGCIVLSTFDTTYFLPYYCGAGVN